MASDITIRAIIDSSGAASGARSFVTALGTMRGGVTATNSSLETMGRRFLSLRSLAAGFIGALGVREFIQAGDNFTMIKARLALFAQEGVTATGVLDALTAAAARSNAPVGALSDIYSRNATALNKLGLSTSDQVRLNESLYKALVVSGNATEGGKEALIQFSQSLNSGVFRGQEFNSVNEQATEIIRILARETGETQGELRKLANEGMLTAGVAVNALLNGSKDLDAEFEQLPQTAGQAATRFADMFSLVIGKSADATGSNKELAAAIGAWTKLIGSDEGRGIIDYFSNGLKDIAQWAGDAAREIKVMAIETKLVAEQQQKAAESGFTWGKAVETVWTVAKLSAGFWADQAKAAMIGTLGLSPEAQAAIRQRAEILADLKGSITKDDSAVPLFDKDNAKRPIQFGSGQESEEDRKRRERLTAQLARQVDLEKDKVAITQAQIAGDTSQVQVLQVQMEIRQRISDEMRSKAAPEKAAALEQEIIQEHALEVQLKEVQAVQARNKQFADDFAGSITNAFGAAIKDGQSFSQTLKQMATDILDVITKAAILEPLGRAIGSSLTGSLNSGGFDIGNMLRLGGGDVGLGPWTPTVTAFANGGVVDNIAVKGVREFAAGGVVDTPTFFNSSAGAGVAGEAGSEAILPLSRRRNGDLGVNASGLGISSVVNNFSFTITGDATDATLAKMQAAAEQMFAQKAPGLIDQSAGEVAKRYRSDKNYLRR